MSIETELVNDSEEWNELVEQSPQRTPFHRYEALEVIEEYSGELYPYVGYKGEEPVGLFPVFSDSKGPVRVVYSPPIGLGVNYLGPILLNTDYLKERKAVRRHHRFISKVDEELRETVDPKHIYIQTGLKYNDPRPFLWNEYTTQQPYFTYITDITPPEDDLMMKFSSDIRQNIRNTPTDTYEITETDGSEIEDTIDLLQERVTEFTVPHSFFQDLYRTLPEGIMRAYSCYSDGEFVGGQITMEENDVLLTWQGIGDRDHTVPVMDVMLWHVIKHARSRGLERIDHGGATYRNLSNYKSKFDPEMKMHYRLDWSSPLVKIYSEVKNIWKIG